MLTYLQKIPERLRLEIEHHSEGQMVIHAGHFVIDTTDELANDHLMGSTYRGLDDFIGLTRLTWEIACAAVQESTSKTTPKLMVLVNDWQFLKPRLAGTRRDRERRAAELRTEYYARTPTLPDYHLQTLTAHNLGAEHVLRFSASQMLFSETVLRQQLARRLIGLMKEKEKAEGLGLRQYFTPSGQMIVRAESSLSGDYSLLYCGSTNCAGEVVQLLKILYDRGVRSFANLYPLQCREPVMAGTDLARQIFGLEGLRVLNIAMPAPGRTGAVESVLVDECTD